MTSANYSVEWHIEIPARERSFSIKPPLDDQELALDQLTYWEGAIDVSGKRGDKEVSGRGYLELTGSALGSQWFGR